MVGSTQMVIASDATRDSGSPVLWRAADRLLWQAVRSGGASLVAFACSALALAAVEIVFPAVLGQGLDAALGRAPSSWLVWFGALLVAVVVFDALDEVALGSTVARSVAWTRRTLTHRIVALGPSAAKACPAGDLTTRVTANASAVGRLPTEMIRGAGNAIAAIGAVVALALIDIWLCVTFLAATPLLALILRAFTREYSSVTEAYFAVQGRLASHFHDALAGSRTIAAAGTLEQETERVLSSLPELQARGTEMWAAQTKAAWQEAIVLPVLEIAVLAVAGLQLSRGRITPGQMVAAAAYAAIASGFGSPVGVVARFGRSRAAARRVADILSVPSPEFGAEDLPEGPGRLELRGVAKTVGSRRVLDGIDLVVPGGTLVAVVGRSGSGKSLLAALAGRLVDPDEGAILLDGVELRRLSHRNLHRAVTFGFERPELLGESIGAAIAFGEELAGSDEVRGAARLARADEFVVCMPNGYGTPVRAAPLSGGERQRVGLARAFAHAGRLLILDDVAASLDTITERDITRTLTRELGGRTRIVVAHRFSTAALADAVVWLEDGRVRAVGTHGELWREPQYRALFGAGADRPERSE